MALGEVFELAAGLLEIIYWLGELLGRALVGWRYLFSARYRAEVHARWATQPSGRTALQILGAGIGVALTLAGASWLLSRLVLTFGWGS